MRRKLITLLAALGLFLGGGTPALAYEPVNVVHAETLQAGPYKLTVGFSTWPLRALQSLDFSFVPEGGIQGRSGTLTILAPETTEGRARPMVRHPRKLDVWGLDVRSLNLEGDWTFKFTVQGDAGEGAAQLTVPVLEQPGPPMALSWAISTLPLFGLIALLVIAWRRTKPGQPAVVTP